MKKFGKIVLIAAPILILLGTVIFCTAFALSNSMGTQKFNEVTHEADGEFTKVSIKSGSSNIVIRPSENGRCYAVCRETDKITFTLSVNNGILTLKEHDERKWTDYIGIFLQNTEAVLYIPDGDYEGLSATLSSGGIVCTGGDISFGDATVKISSGGVKFSDISVDSINISASSGGILLKNCKATSKISLKASSGGILFEDSTANEVSLECTSGGISVKNCEAISKIDSETSSGGLSLEKCSANDISVKCTSGGIKLSNVIALLKLSVKVSSGAIKLDRCDGNDIRIESSSGSVKGTLCSGKIFEVHTGSGNADYPKSVSGSGTCQIKASSGNVKIEIAK